MRIEIDLNDLSGMALNQLSYIVDEWTTAKIALVLDNWTKRDLQDLKEEMEDPERTSEVLESLRKEVNHLIEINENLEWVDQITLDDSRNRTQLDVFFNGKNLD